MAKGFHLEEKDGSLSRSQKTLTPSPSLLKTEEVTQRVQQPVMHLSPIGRSITQLLQTHTCLFPTEIHEPPADYDAVGIEMNI